MSPTTPLRLDLKKDRQLEIEWADGRVCIYPIAMLRRLCPCAACRTRRDEERKNPMKLNVLSGDVSAPLSALHAELVGNYALRIDWSDQHGSGIYSFQYLREICPGSEPA